MEDVDNSEEQIKSSHKNLEEALDRVNELEKKLEERNDEFDEIRVKITKVAELFERKKSSKSIPSRYFATLSMIKRRDFLQSTRA